MLFSGQESEDNIKPSEFVISDGILTKCIDPVGDIVIPDGVE